MPVDLLVGSTVQKVWEEHVRKGILQVKDAAGPAATGGVVDGHGPPLEIILQTQPSEITASTQDDKSKNPIKVCVKRHLVILVGAALWHLISLKHLLRQTFLPLLLLVQGVGIKACTQLVVPEGAASQSKDL